MTVRSARIAVLIPCYNEELTIGQTVAGFRKALPAASIYVYDNNSKDRTVEQAAKAGAIVRCETLQGKGHVVRRVFSVVDFTCTDTRNELGSGAGRDLARAARRAIKPRLRSADPARGASIAAERCRKAGL
jgi:glycosyltransferase involved in cell wall biosynthesis